MCELNLLEVKDFNLCVKENHLIKDFNLTVKKGEIIGIAAPNGSGKSSLIKKICGCMEETAEYYATGEITFPKGKNISVCFQTPSLLSTQTVYKNLYIGLKNKMTKQAADTVIKEILTAVNLLDKIKEKAKNLSGGQQQRLSLARALSYPCSLLLLDEPFVYQDEANYKKLLEYTKAVIAEKGLSAVIISHNSEELDFLCTKIISIV